MTDMGLYYADGSRPSDHYNPPQQGFMGGISNFMNDPERMGMLMSGLNMMQAAQGGSTDMSKQGMGYILNQGLQGGVQGYKLGQGFNNQKAEAERKKNLLGQLQNLTPEQKAIAEMAIAKGDVSTLNKLLTPSKPGFEGTSMTAQANNILMYGDPNSKEYAMAHNFLTTPRQIQTESGTINVTPTIPQGFVPPSYGKPQAPINTMPKTKPGVIPGTEKTSKEQLDYNKEFSALYGITNSFNRLGNTLKETGSQPGVGPLSLDPKTRAKLQSNYKATQLALKNAFELGVLSKDDAKILTEFLADPTGIDSLVLGDEGVAASYNSGLDYIQDSIDTLNKRYEGTHIKSKKFPKLKRLSGEPLSLTNSKGWVLMEDVNGNKAYVGPNNEIEEVK